MGLAILGTVLVTVMRNQVTSSLIAQGVPIDGVGFQPPGAGRPPESAC